ncbi:hypothetical protein [Phenylobacterium sp. J367]|uniref:hypothetical protein n=1 Tax=Phenylobacterium sp. J367 TaxID=2898435 RepID=UPI0021506EDE|nr:hypothetical protein [Phenylobacterium sp. J367]MCR5880046.1 hypothetical protein [Phenylobacterium sp. J367]
MRDLALAAALILSGATLSACATSGPDGRVQTRGEATREDITGAVSAPLRDVNVLRSKIPVVLLKAMADPYERPPNTRCATLIALIQPIDQAMGADIDTPTTDEESLMSRETAYGAVASVASSAIPFRGFVRTLSGAERHDAFVQQAILAGSVRRAYLKGLGEAKGCKPPATPSHVKAGSSVPEVSGELKPRYPTRRPGT